MSGILALELLGGIDRRFGLQSAVIDVDQIELCLAGFRAERITRLERIEILNRPREVRPLHGVVTALVEQLGTLILDDVVARTAS